MIEKGTILKCKTTTKNDVFGTVMWEVVETGLQAPERGREAFKDGVKVVMLGGSGPSARAGLTIIDSEWHIEQDVRAGVTTILPNSGKDAALGQIKKASINTLPRHGGTGVVEL